MKNKKMFMVFLIALIVVSVGAIVYSSYAFFSSTDVVKNTLSLGKVKITLEEPNWDDINKGQKLIPGKTLLKDPTVEETEGTSYTRVILEIVDSKGNLITDQNRINTIVDCIYYDTSYDKEAHTTKNLLEGSSYSHEELQRLIAEEKIYNLFNADAFVKDNIRSTSNKFVFKVSDQVKLGDKNVLFTNIVIPVEYTNTEMSLLGDFDLRITAEAIQVDGFDTPEDAFTSLDTNGGNR